MNEWMAQWYANVPAALNVNEPDVAARITPVSQTPVSEVDVWLNASRLVHVTVSPTRTVVVGGTNAEPWMFTALVAASATSGSGAGFPGLALQLALPGTQVTLVESMGKKARFLEEVTSTLALDGVEVRNERAEALAHTRRERYDVATARAVGTLGAIVEYLLPFLRVGGDAIAWKGRLDAELPGARKACAAIGGEIVKITPTSELGLGTILPGRSLVVIRKLRATQTRYPRSPAEAKRRPW